MFVVPGSPLQVSIKLKYTIVCKLYEVKACCQCLGNVSHLYFDWILVRPWPDWPER